MIFTNKLYQKKNSIIVSSIYLRLVNKLFLHHLVIFYDLMIVRCCNSKWLKINIKSLFVPWRTITSNIGQCKRSRRRHAIQRMMFVEDLKRKKSNEKHTAPNEPMNQMDFLVRWIEEEYHLHLLLSRGSSIVFEFAGEYFPKTLGYGVEVDQKPAHKEFFECSEKQKCS